MHEGMAPFFLGVRRFMHVYAVYAAELVAQLAHETLIGLIMVLKYFSISGGFESKLSSAGALTVVAAAILRKRIFSKF
ncbi:hypothetical protein P4H42_22310 [Paenibacillus macerans]|uniref:hypothetical protein n=1 Tax=Paenibacillus macerans TaxID=44252 RepID=UPI0012D9DEAC|nr:hypothetical protein [Paenibacillus macerans]MEC0332336.1 hypothetical protein [Paenibacillus macerans]